MDTVAGKFLTFALGREEYGLRVLKVREIIKVMDITQVPQVPAHVRGVINLRGRVIPVIDLRLKFGLPWRDYTERTCIIVVEVMSAGMLGVVVDSVSEVVNVTAADTEDASAVAGCVSAEYLLGLAKVKGTVKILLDLDRVLAADAFVGARAS